MVRWCVVIPSERSESRDLHLHRLTRSSRSTTENAAVVLGSEIRAPAHRSSHRHTPKEFGVGIQPFVAPDLCALAVDLRELRVNQFAD